jgi:uncharacterized membrane protein YfcA
MPVPFADLVIAMAVIAVAATFQGIVGIGFNVMAVPILLLLDPLLAPVPNLLLGLPLVVSQLMRERSDIDRSGVTWILVGRIPGGLAGLWLLLVLDQRALDATLALIILSLVALMATGVAMPRTRTTEVAAGTFSGIGGIIGAVGGPPVGLLYKDAPAPVVRSTLGVVFSIGMVISIVLRAAGGRIAATDLQVALWLLPAMVIGFRASTGVKDRVPADWIRRGILLISTAASMGLLARAILG